MEDMVLPATKQNPDDIRPDGKQKGSNGKIFGKFEHCRTVWKVHYDTRYRPLELAYDNASDNKDPFVTGFTKIKKNPKLKLRSDIRELQSQEQDSKRDYDYLNIYLSKS